MDTITHGIAGALISKAAFRGDDMFAVREMNGRRIVTWAMMLGAIFPDIDTLRDNFSHNELLIITWHRSYTHSLLCLPIFAVLLAALTRAVVRWRKWDAPSFLVLTAIYAAGILSHILLDLVTTFGTMIWSPANWARPAWDLLFIVDFTFSGILLVPQFAAWAHERPEKSRRRALICLALFILAVLLIQKMGEGVGAPISLLSVWFFMALLAAIFLFPLRGKRPIPPAKNVKVDASGGENLASKTLSPENFRAERLRRRWSLGGVVVGCAYIVMAMIAHRAALNRVKNFGASQKLEAQSIGALPFPPSLWKWDGLVQTPRGVYELRMDLSEPSPFEVQAATNPTASSPTDQTAPSAIERNARPAVAYRFYPEAPTNSYIAAARELPEVQKVLWFQRFPVTHFHQEHGEQVVDFSDVRFPQIGRRGRPSPFTYRVRFDPSGRLLSQGWAK